MIKEITPDVISTFLNGHDPMERIINIECSYMEDKVTLIYVDERGKKRMRKEPFTPFVWTKQSVGRGLFNGDRNLLRKKMAKYNIWSKGLNIYDNEGNTSERLEDGYRVMFYARSPMSYNKFMQFFNEGGKPIFSKDSTVSSSRDFLSISPVEQYMIQTGKRMFKGYDDYNDLLRLVFDLETQGLDPETCAIDKIGIRTNKGYEKIITITGEGEERLKNELNAIRTCLEIMWTIKPDIIAGQNSENFDWQFLMTRLEVCGSSMEIESLKFFPKAIYKKKKPSILKLGGEMEYFRQTVIWGFNVTDSLHAIRRAQAIDSNMKKADLKYVTKYSKLNKPNRVYVPGDQIKTVCADLELNYAFNELNGDWYKITEIKPLKEGYTTQTGQYIIDRYLLDDLYETDVVELRYNQSNFLLGKLLPTTFGRVCTMGTAGTWKMLMLAWSYENDLAIPAYSSAGTFTGGLSRLLSVGYVNRIVKLDYNSLYPAIILSWLIKTKEDISGIMLKFLEFILSEREKYKELKKIAGKKAQELKEELKVFEGTEEEKNKLIAEIQKWESEEAANDKKQLPYKIFGNSFFGGFGAPNIFNWGDLLCAENTTCNGRQSLRLMIKWFSDRKYKPIVGDSFLGDTPLFVKHKVTNVIEIMKISDIINSENIQVDVLGREYDYSEKSFQVLCRSGWQDISYVYRHKTNKKIYRVETENGLIDVTEDHSLFDEHKNKIHSKNIKIGTKLEMYVKNIYEFNELVDSSVSYLMAYEMGVALGTDINGNVPVSILNCDIGKQKTFLRGFMLSNGNCDISIRNKTCISGLLFLKNNIKK